MALTGTGKVESGQLSPRHPVSTSQPHSSQVMHLSVDSARYQSRFWQETRYSRMTLEIPRLLCNTNSVPPHCLWPVNLTADKDIDGDLTQDSVSAMNRVLTSY
jgi:hypothetical protein